MITELKETGIARLGVLPFVGAFTEHLGACPRYPGHVKARPRLGVECYAMSDVLAAPYFLQLAQFIQPSVSLYFGSPAVLWSLNAFYTDEATPFMRGVNGLHRDKEADKILTLFMLCYDTPASGAQLVLGPDGEFRGVYGPAGTAWLADTTNPHCGLMPTTSRLIAWARYADKLPQAFYDEGLPVIP